MMIVLQYVDGDVFEGHAEDWIACRSDGLDRVTVGHVEYQGHSVYWLRLDALGRWVLGAASFYENQASETTFEVDESQAVAKLADDEIPDLKHEDVKLGWWWPRG